MVSVRYWPAGGQVRDSTAFLEITVKKAANEELRRLLELYHADIRPIGQVDGLVGGGRNMPYLFLKKSCIDRGSKVRLSKAAPSK